MKRIAEKPTPEAKALSLFLMDFKSSSHTHKEKARQMNKLWDQVNMEKMTKAEYWEQVRKALASFGGYTAVVEKTVRFYIEKTGTWKLNGNDKYCLDAKKIADQIMKEKK